VWRESVHRKRRSPESAPTSLVTDEPDAEEPLTEKEIAKCA